MLSDEQGEGSPSVLEKSSASFALFTLTLSLILEMARGEQPFDDFEHKSDVIRKNLDAIRETLDENAQAALLLLQYKIDETYDAKYRNFIQSHLQISACNHMTRQLGGNQFSDEDEVAFLENVLRKDESPEANDGISRALRKIYGFEEFDTTNIPEASIPILRFIQTQRNKDKGYGRDMRGFRANHVHDKVIAYAIQYVAAKELECDEKPEAITVQTILSTMAEKANRLPPSPTTHPQLATTAGAPAFPMRVPRSR
jgi:hypothetical protein